MVQMPRLAASSAMAPTTGSSISAPVGLLGELRMIALVLGVIAPRIASADTRKPSVELVCTMTGTAPTSFTCSGIVGQYGACVITSSPGLKSASAVLKSACLPPTVRSTSAAVTSTP
jgi:hypothetical protein